MARTFRLFAQNARAFAAGPKIARAVACSGGLLATAALFHLSSSTALSEPAAGATGGRRTFEPCPEVSCKSKEELLAMFGGNAGGNDGFRAGRRKPSGAGTANATSSSPAAVEHSLGCPPDRELLGQSTWTFLHALAAYYPEHPTEEEKSAVRGLVQALKLLYPCSHCRAQLVVDLEKLPVEPALASRTELSLWVCRQHNFVNASLGKKEFSCSIESLDERWRKGRPECWGGVSGSAAASGGSGSEVAEESLGRMSVEEEAKEEEEDEERMKTSSKGNGPSRIARL